MDKSVLKRINKGVKGQPSLNTDRLVLRPLMAKDALAVRNLANNPEIARRVVWPLCGCGRTLARRWIAGSREHWAAGTGVEFGIELKSEGEMFGLAGLTDVDARNASAELGFLLDPGCWGQGYATEAADAVVSYGFECLELNRIYARHLATNPASGRVLAKLGMRQEGVLRGSVRKEKLFEDAVLVALLREEWTKPADE
jgi:RimJ/RimL family protein N-acetyltransferase